MISIDFHYETFLLLFLVSALVICIVLKLKKRKFYDFIFNYYSSVIFPFEDISISIWLSATFS